MIHTIHTRPAALLFLLLMLLFFACRFLARMNSEPGVHVVKVTERKRITGAVLDVVLLCWVAVLLAGCGGGDDDDRADTQPVNCREQPRVCAR